MVRDLAEIAKLLIVAVIDVAEICWLAVWGWIKVGVRRWRRG